MPLVTGLKKMFHKRNLYDFPNQYRLTPKEKESVGLFISIVTTALLTMGVTMLLN